MSDFLKSNQNLFDEHNAIDNLTNRERAAIRYITLNYDNSLNINSLIQNHLNSKAVLLCIFMIESSVVIQKNLDLEALLLHAFQANIIDFFKFLYYCPSRMDESHPLFDTRYHFLRMFWNLKCQRHDICLWYLQQQLIHYPTITEEEIESILIGLSQSPSLAMNFLFSMHNLLPGGIPARLCQNFFLSIIAKSSNRN